MYYQGFIERVGGPGISHPQPKFPPSRNINSTIYLVLASLPRILGSHACNSHDWNSVWNTDYARSKYCSIFIRKVVRVVGWHCTTCLFTLVHVIIHIPQTPFEAYLSVPYTHVQSCILCVCTYSCERIVVIGILKCFGEFLSGPLDNIELQRQSSQSSLQLKKQMSRTSLHRQQSTQVCDSYIPSPLVAVCSKRHYGFKAEQLITMYL